MIRIPLSGVTPTARGLAIAGDRAVWAAGRSVVIGAPDRDPVRLELEFAIDRVAIHPDASHAFAIGGDGRQLAVLALAAPAVAFTLGAADAPRMSMRAGFARLAGAPLLVAAHKKGELHGYDLARHAPVFWVNVGAPLAFHLDHAVALADDQLALLGHHFSDTLDTLEIVTTDELRHDAQTLQNALADRTGVRDVAVGLAVGPCGADSIVIARDPEDSEDRDPDDDDPPVGELEGYRGLYVRSLATGAITARIAYAGEIRSGARIGGDARVIAIDHGRRIDVIDRATATVSAITGDVIALDPYRLRIARLAGDAIEISDA